MFLLWKENVHLPTRPFSICCVTQDRTPQTNEHALVRLFIALLSERENLFPPHDVTTRHPVLYMLHYYISWNCALLSLSLPQLQPSGQSLHASLCHSVHVTDKLLVSLHQSLPIRFQFSPENWQACFIQLYSWEKMTHTRCIYKKCDV